MSPTAKDVPAGQDLRTKPGEWERATNAQQKRLVRAYDQWAIGLRKELTGAVNRLATEADQLAILERRLGALERVLLTVTRQGVVGASNLVLRGRRPTPATLLAAQKQMAANNQLVIGSLMPSMRQSLQESIRRGAALDKKALKLATDALRSRPAQYAGGYWVMIFQTQQALGIDREAERRAKGEAIEKVRWVLDRLADHCEDSPGFHGCAGLAGEYKGGWNTLKTVPGGQVTCRGNCRCTLEVFTEGEWKRRI